MIFSVTAKRFYDSDKPEIILFSFTEVTFPYCLVDWESNDYYRLLLENQKYVANLLKSILED